LGSLTGLTQESYPENNLVFKLYEYEPFRRAGSPFDLLLLLLSKIKNNLIYYFGPFL
jgi:hypothetical protein